MLKCSNKHADISLLLKPSDQSESRLRPAFWCHYSTQKKMLDVMTTVIMILELRAVSRTLSLIVVFRLLSMTAVLLGFLRVHVIQTDFLLQDDYLNVFTGT